MNRHPHSPLRNAARLLMLVIGVWLTGCASVPEPLREAPQTSPDPAAVRATPDKYAGTKVRWGGIIAAVENEANESEIQVVSRPLADSTRPQETDASSGRFIVRIKGFVDPIDYSAGREITVIGVLDGVEQRNIGKYPYSFPLVRATSYYLWPLRPPPIPDSYYYYSPLYNPWYPYGLYPYP